MIRLRLDKLAIRGKYIFKFSIFEYMLNLLKGTYTGTAN